MVAFGWAEKYGRSLFALYIHMYAERRLEFAPGKLFAPYYTIVIHSSNSSSRLVAGCSPEALKVRYVFAPVSSGHSHNWETCRGPSHAHAHGAPLASGVPQVSSTCTNHSYWWGSGLCWPFHARQMSRSAPNSRISFLTVFSFPHFFPSSLSLGAGNSVVFFSLSHQSFQNFSSSTRFFSLACLSSLLASMVANHSSRAASSSARVAYWFMQLFIAFCCARHEKVAVKVLLVQQAAKSEDSRQVPCRCVLHRIAPCCSRKTYL